MEILEQKRENGRLEVKLLAGPEECRMETGETVESEIVRLFGRYLGEARLRTAGVPKVTEVASTTDGSLRFSVEAELYPEVRLGRYKGIEVPVRRAAGEDAFTRAVLEKACAEMEAELTEALVRDRLDAMIAQERLNVNRDSIYYLLADAVEILGEVYNMAGCSRQQGQVEGEALDILLQAVSSDNQGPEVEYMKDQMHRMAARYRELPDDFDGLIDDAFARRQKKKGRMTADELGREAFHAYLRTVGLDEEQLERERRPAAASAARCDLLFEAVAAAEGLAVTQDELEAEVARLAARYQVTAEELAGALDSEALRRKLLRDKACALILDSAVEAAPGAGA